MIDGLVSEFAQFTAEELPKTYPLVFEPDCMLKAHREMYYEKKREMLLKLASFTDPERQN